MDTFIVRMWRTGLTGPDAPPQGMRGVVTHLASGHQQVFRTPGELLAFLEASVARSEVPPTLSPEPAPDGRGPEPRG